MTIETFTQADFVKVFEDAQLHFDDRGWQYGERVYDITLDTHSSIRIRSSIRNDGQSAEVGKDSIRCWLVTDTGESIISKSASQKLQDEHYITRVPGWQERLIKKIEYLRLLKLNIGNCLNCGHARIVLVASRNAKPQNVGKLFSTCPHCKKFGNFLNVDTLENLGKQTSTFSGTIRKQSQDELSDWKSVTGAATVNTSARQAFRESFIKSISEIKDDTLPLLGSDSTLSNDSTKQNASVGESESVPSNGLISFLEAATMEEESSPAPVIVKEFKPSKYQEAIRDFVLNESDALRVEAYAGSGKTSTNAFVCRALPEKCGNVKMMVFSKANQLDMEKKIPEWIPATTTHSAGFADIRRVYKNVKVDERKTLNIFKDLYQNDYEIREFYPQVAKLVSLCKNTLSPASDETLDELCERYDVVTNGSREQIYDAVARVLKISSEQTNVIDFDDMLWFPASGQVSVASADLLFVDEYQDNNFAQETYYLKTGARIIFVGDAKQAIYGFRGAMIGAMDAMQRKLNAHQLPLPISYRCAKSVIQLAQTIVPQIMPRDDAPDGLVADCLNLKLVKPGDLVLCRNNAPLVKPCFELIQSGIKATIKGRDIGKNLLGLIAKVEKRNPSTSFLQMIGNVMDYVDTESAKLVLQHKESQAASLQDQADTIWALADGCGSLSDLESRVNRIFADDVQGVQFSTIHKIKGGEADRVFIIKPELLNAQKYDTKDWQLEQLQNLNYVAITRARQELYFVRG